MSGRLRILHIGNGRAFKIKAIADAFVERGHDVHMAPIPPCDGAWPDVTWHRLPDPVVPGQAKVLARMAQVRRLVRALNPDIVHAHNAWGPGWYGAAAGRRPLVVHAYGGDVLPEQYAGRPWFQRALTSWACRNADRLVVTGRHMVAAAAQLGIAPDRLVVLPRGVDCVRYRRGLDTTPLRARLGLQRASPVILSPRYQVDEPLYNHDIVLEAFAAFRGQFPDAVCLQLHEAGRGASLQRLASRYQLGDSYRLVPSVDNADMPAFYNLADVVVSVPSSDGFPVTVLEASACGAALVVSDLPFCAEWFQDGVNGLVVPVRDAGALTRAMAALCADAGLRRSMGSAGRRLVAARADARRCTDALEQMYRDLIRASLCQKETQHVWDLRALQR